MNITIQNCKLRRFGSDKVFECTCQVEYGLSADGDIKLNSVKPDLLANLLEWLFPHPKLAMESDLLIFLDSWSIQGIIQTISLPYTDMSQKPTVYSMEPEHGHDLPTWQNEWPDSHKEMID